MSKLSDTEMDKLPKRFKVGSTHPARITGYNYVDAIFFVSLQQSVLEAPFLRAQDVKPGTLVKAIVVSLESFGVIVAITNKIKALCPTTHLADVPLKFPHKKFEVGKPILCRVLTNAVKDNQQRIVVTHKKTLVKSELAILADYVSVKPGAIAHGIITSVKPTGCVVTFYDNIRGMTPLRELGIDETLNVSDFFKEGQLVKARVLRVNATKRRMQLSFVLDAAAAPPRATVGVDSTSDIITGTLHTVQVLAASETRLTVKLEGTEIVSHIALVHATDHLCLGKHYAQRYAAGDTIEDVLVVAKDNKGKLLLSLKPLLKKTASTAPRTLTDLQEDSLHVGYVRSVTSYGCFVGLVHGLVGLVDLKNLSTRYVADPTKDFMVGQTVLVKVLRIDYAQLRVNFTMAFEETTSPLTSPKAMIRSYFEEVYRLAGEERLAKVAHLHIGQVITVTVKNVRDVGVIVELDDGLPGFIIQHQARDAALSPGDQIAACILDIDVFKGIVDLTLNPELIEKASTAKKSSKKSKKAKLEEADAGDATTGDSVIQLVKVRFGTAGCLSRRWRQLEVCICIGDVFSIGHWLCAASQNHFMARLLQQATNSI